MLEVAAAAFFLVSLVRTFRVVKVLMIRGVKPFACDLCMSFWASVAVVAPQRHDSVADVVTGLAGAGLCLLVLTVLGRIPELFPSSLLDDAAPTNPRGTT